MNKKYELIDACLTMHDNSNLYMIKALRDFSDVKKGDIGGYVTSESNLSHDGNCWIYEGSMVINNATVKDNAIVKDRATVVNDAFIIGNSVICDNSLIYDNAIIGGDTIINARSRIGKDAYVMCIDDYINLSGLLDDSSTGITFYRTQDPNIVLVKHGRFNDTIDKFEQQIPAMYEDYIYARNYLLLTQVAKAHFGIV